MTTIKTIEDYENLCIRSVFRGQANQNWPLLPSAYRDGSNINCPSIEKTSVNDFIRHLRENGYRNFLRQLERFDFLTNPDVIFPKEELLPWWALAQHYAFDSQFCGLRTSLLDVTHNLDIAAYFAVENNVEAAVDGQIFVFDRTAIKEPYKLYEPRGGSRLEARLVVQDCAFIYREQKTEFIEDSFPYKNTDPFDDIVKDKIIIPSNLKPALKEHLQKKLCDLFIYPRLVLGRVTPNLATAGCHSYEELKKLNASAVARAESLGDKHSDY